MLQRTGEWKRFEELYLAMLQVSKGATFAQPEDTDELGGASLKQLFAAIWRIIRRQWPLFIILLACCVALGIFYLFMTPSAYTAWATMVIDTRKVQLFQQQSVLGETPIDTAMVQTQVEVLKSDNVSLAVIRDFHLTEDPEFVSGSSGLIGTALSALTGLFGEAGTPTASQLERSALSAFESRRTVNRVGLTYVMEIGFRSLNPDKSAKIANAIADAYIADQLQAKYEAARRASAWLQDRIKELRQQATDADRAAVNFKQAHNIVDANGKLMNEQQLAEVNSQLILAHATTAEAKARLDRMSDIMKQTLPDASVTDALKNEVIIRLRSQYLELASKQAIWAAKYGANHLATIGLRTQMQEIRSRITEEMQKIAESYKSEYEIALARENSIRSSLAQSVSESQTTNQAQIQLRELESTAQTSRTMYDNFLQRYMEAVQQQSFPITEARLISAAVRPLGRSEPKAGMVLALTIAGSLFLSFSIAFIREMADNVFRTGAQIEEKLRISCLALIPAVKPSANPVPARAALETSSQHTRLIAPSAGLFRHAVEAPFSQFAEALRAVKLAVDLGNIVKSNKVIGFTSSLPNEGKSTVSANFAQLIAQPGGRVLLVDGDLRNPSLSRALAPVAEAGLVDVLGGRRKLEDVLWTDPSSGLHFLPVGGGGRLMHTSEILGSEGIQKFFYSLREQYEYIIVDFAPLAPVVDTRATTAFIDSYVFVLEWGQTKVDVVEHALADAREVYDRLLGVALNKTDMSVMGRYERHRSDTYYRKYYTRYGYGG